MEKAYLESIEAEKRMELAWNYGEYITAVVITDRVITLFRLEKFFVEIHTDKECNCLIEVNVQDDPDILYAYLVNLNIDDLFETEI